jgi:hypothetical protein
MTDPGFYAMSHFHQAAPVCPVAMPISASRGLWRFSQRPFLLAQPGLAEEAFLQTLDVPAPMIAPHGTVASTALDLASFFTRGPVIFAGLDMCTEDIISHARPNVFERFFHLQNMRTTPFDSLLFGQSAEQNAVPLPGDRRARVPISLKTYSGWLGSQQRRSRVFRLFPSIVDIPGMVPIDAAQMKEIIRDLASISRGSQLRRYALPSRHLRARSISKILSEWRQILPAAAREARGPSGLRALDSMPISALVNQLATRQILEVRRKARLGDQEGARETAVQLLEECERFLGALEERAVHAA